MALMLYSIDALPEAEVVSLAHHVDRCPSCRRRLINRDELRAAAIEVYDGRHANPANGQAKKPGVVVH